MLQPQNVIGSLDISSNVLGVKIDAAGACLQLIVEMQCKDMWLTVY